MNYYVRDTDRDRLKTLKEEYESMGRECNLDGDTLTVYARKQKGSTKKREARPRRRNDDD